MLTDDQVDKLERMFWSSTIDEMPMILGRYLPLLFQELRTVRQLYHGRVEEFFAEPTTDLVRDHDVKDQQLESGVPDGAERAAHPTALRQRAYSGTDPISSVSESKSVGGSGDSGGSDAGADSQLIPHRKRGRPKGSRNKVRVGRADSGAEVGGEVLAQS